MKFCWWWRTKEGDRESEWQRVGARPGARQLGVALASRPNGPARAQIHSLFGQAGRWPKSVMN